MRREERLRELETWLEEHEHDPPPPPKPEPLFLGSSYSDDYTWGIVFPAVACAVVGGVIYLGTAVITRAADLVVGTPVRAIRNLVRTGRIR